ncbi:MAG TPA: HEPN domain-containing protein [Methylomicrobium sp.]|jgi:HEPN domain-containing protein|nr:HEPN domain-containing protein [Methylomicrobium sp.]
MRNKFQEWFRQADYDMDTADAMFASGRYFYAVFMCHLSLEKALKGLIAKRLDELPPKTHNLLYLLNMLALQPPSALERFIARLNTASVATRYPDDLAKMQAAYTENVTKELIMKSKEVLEWAKTQLQQQ